MSSQCEECGNQDINELNEEYNWCNPCLKNFKNFVNSENFTTRLSDEKNEKIDNLIQEMQSNIKGPSDIIFEWIPYNQFIDINEEGKGEIAKACSAIWKDGPLIYSYFKKKFERVPYKKVVIKYLFNSKDIIDKILEEVKIYSINYSNNVYVYGISQDPNKKDYMIVFNAKALRKQIDDFNAEKRRKLEKLIKEKTKDFGFNYFEYTKFNSLKEIGRGGFSIVKRAKIDGGNKVVLKGFIDENLKIENVVNNFVKELELLRMIHSHQNIIRFRGVSKDNIGYVMVFEHANEGNLRDYLYKFKKFDSLQWENKIRMALDITRGLKYLHSKDIVHRDLHSKNILVNNGGLLIADFGLSKQLTEIKSSSVDNRMGMIEYVEPQCFSNVNYVKDKRSDVYSLGVLLWEITSGHPPFYKIEERGMLSYHIVHSNLREEPIKDTPSEYIQLYKKCWDGDPNERPDINQVYDMILSQSSELFEEEWIKKKMEDEEICYFEYSEFSKIEEIGIGGFGVVRKAMTDDGLKVALKGLIESNKSSKFGRNIIKPFVNELKHLRKVSNHPNINSFLGITKDDIGYVLVLGYANEGNLRDYLKKKFDSLQWENKIQMALDITCGLKRLHSKGIIHRDLHSKNILVNDGRLLIADFGLSKHLTEVTSNSLGNRTGIDEYTDPQCFKDVKYVRREKSDIYSLGVLLWEITSGKPPFHDDNERDGIAQHNLRCHICYENLREEPIEGTPLKYQQLYQRCWDGDPEKRPDINEVYKEILSQSKVNEDPLVTSTSNDSSGIFDDICIE